MDRRSYVDKLSSWENIVTEIQAWTRFELMKAELLYLHVTSLLFEVWNCIELIINFQMTKGVHSS